MADSACVFGQEQTGGASEGLKPTKAVGFVGAEQLASKLVVDDRRNDSPMPAEQTPGQPLGELADAEPRLPNVASPRRLTAVVKAAHLSRTASAAWPLPRG